MTLLTERPRAEDPDAGVIEEARARQRRQRGIAGAAIILAAGIAAIVVVAGGGGSHSTQGSTRPARVPAKTAASSLIACAGHSPASVPATPSRALLSILGVLRTPATPSDALPRGTAFVVAQLSKLSGIRVFSKYIRLARVVDGRPYYVWPAVQTDCGTRPSARPAGTEVIMTGGSGWAGGGATATEIKQALTIGPNTGGFGHSTIVGLVPDGVASVTLRYPAGKIGGFDRHHAPAFTTTIRVVGNLIVATIPRGGQRVIGPVEMIWRTTNGKALKTFSRL
jgi:hypothetical protein